MWLILLGLGAVGVYAVKEKREADAANAYAAQEHAAAQAAQQALAERERQDWRNPRPLLGMTPRRHHSARYDAAGNYRRS